MDNHPLYNSRIIRTYVEYLQRNYPDIAIDPILDLAGMTASEVRDGAHWFTQNQVDRFYKRAELETGNPNIAREAGRFSASAEGLGAAKQYTLGLMNLTSIYLLMGKLYPLLSRGADVQAKKIKSNKVEIIVIPKQGVAEKPHQCDNRIGFFEAIAEFLHKTPARVEHPSCFHKGDNCCHYIVTWERSPAHIWKQLRNYGFLVGMTATPALFFILHPKAWGLFVLVAGLVTVSFAFVCLYLEKRALIDTVKAQGDAAKDLLEETNIRYNNAIFAQEIGQAISSVLDIDALIRTVVRVMEKRLDFDRGMIMTPNKQETRLVYRGGYGYEPGMEEVLTTTGFHLDNPRSRGPAAEAFKKQKPFLVNDISEIEKTLSEKSRAFVRQMLTQSFICVPILYEHKSLGVIIVDNIRSKRTFTTSDMNLLMSVASQAAVSMANAISFQKLQASEEKYRTILESIEEGYFEVDLSGNLTFFNDSVCKILGYAHGELRNMNNRAYTDADTASKMFGIFNEIFRTGRPATIMDYQIVRKDGGKRALEISAYLMNDQEGKPIGFRGVVRDVTEKKQTEEMRRAKLAAEAASRAKSRFLANMSHEIRTPLNGIIGMTELAMATEMDGNQRKILETLHAESDALLGIINDILDFSKIEAEMLELEETPFDLSEMVDYLVNSFAHRATQKGLAIRASMAPEVPTGVSGDPGRLRQILTNLVANALKFTEKGGITIDISVAEDLGEQVKLRFSVTDTGIGIPEDKRDAIFESFTQADSSTTRKYGGTGLGITISKQLAEMMGGEVGVESEVGAGSHFWFTAVLARQSIDEAARIKREAEEFADEGNVKDLRKSSRILLVEDYPTNQEVAMSHLRAAGYDVDLAENGLEALELFKQNIYRAILMDVQMPVMDGYEATRQIRKLEARSRQLPFDHMADDDQHSIAGNAGRQLSIIHGRSSSHRVPIIAMTGHAVEGYRKECLEAGMDDYLSKPLTGKHFLAMVDKWTGALANSEARGTSLKRKTQSGLEMSHESRFPQTSDDLQTTIPHARVERGTPMDFEKTLNEFEGDKALLMEVLKGFVVNVKEQIKIIGRALLTQDAERVRREAHSIKGGAANLRADQLSRIAFELEKIGKSGELEQGIDVLERLQTELAELEKLASIL
ncbi:MAG: PAS domain S-box protein [Deltaproteobacteria bacterium]|nr:PAS domain S-box protein [Deltaproteobacteria bacterium]